jgi:hypothetical protein
MDDETEVLETPAVIEDTEVKPVERSEPIEDKAALEAKVADNLKAVFGDEEVDDEPAPKEDAPTETQDESGAATEETPAEEKETPPPSIDSKVPTLPAAYVRSLKAYDWTDAEISDAAKQPGFLSTAAKIHQNRVKETAAWADQGRKVRQESAPAPRETPVKTDPDIGELKPLDAAELKKTFGEDKLIDVLVGPLNKAIERINRAMPVVEANQRTSEQAKLETLGNQIETFFGGKELEPFKNVYGSMKTGLKEDHIQSRNKVLELADALVLGAQKQGRALTLGDALTLAHDSVSSGFKEQAVRTTIKNNMKTRNRGITLKPGGSRVAPPTAVQSRKQLERKVGDALAATFGRS